MTAHYGIIIIIIIIITYHYYYVCVISVDSVADWC